MDDAMETAMISAPAGMLDVWVRNLEQHLVCHADNPRFVNATIMRIQAVLTRLAPVDGAFSELPLEIVADILGRLPIGRDWIRAASVCKLFHKAVEALCQQQFQTNFGACKSTERTWKQSMFEARHLTTQTQKQRGHMEWKEKALLCGIVDHATIKQCDFNDSDTNLWKSWLPKLYATGLGNVAAIFWSLASQHMFRFVQAVNVIDDILGVYPWRQTMEEQKNRLHRVETFMYHMVGQFKPTWTVTEPQSRGHLMHIHTGLPNLYTLTQIVVSNPTDNHYQARFPRVCDWISRMWHTVLHKLSVVDPTFYSLVMWTHVNQDVARMLAPHLPNTFFLKPFFPGTDTIGSDIDNLPPTFFAQPYRVPDDAGILHCIFNWNKSWHVSDYWGNTLRNAHYVIRNTPLCHYEIMHIVCHMCDVDLLTIALARGVNKTALHPERDALHDAPLLTFFKSTRKEKRVYDSKTTQFVAALVHDGYPCLLSTPASWSPGRVLEANEDAFWEFWEKLPTHIQPDIWQLLTTHVTTLTHLATRPNSGHASKK